MQLTEEGCHDSRRTCCVPCHLGAYEQTKVRYRMHDMSEEETLRDVPPWSLRTDKGAV
jgi:hypothetical protein